MKRYIKPNTEIQQIELMQMIAQSMGVNNNQEVSDGTSGWTDLSKQNNFSVWGDSDEEE